MGLLQDRDVFSAQLRGPQRCGEPYGTRTDHTDMYMPRPGYTTVTHVAATP